MNWTPEQNTALTRVAKWVKNPRKPFFYLAGYAGTGKTTLAKHLAEDVVGDVLFAAYTGKAAHVLKSKGCTNASTVHSLIYVPKGECRARLNELEDRLVLHESGKEKLSSEELEMLRDAISAERLVDSQPSFALNEDSDLKQASLLVLDECFVRGTLVHTPRGEVPIETLAPGDQVYNALGVDTVSGTTRRKVSYACQINTGGITIACSPSHRFFTERGLVAAAELTVGDRLARTSACVRLLRDEVSSDESHHTVLLDTLLNEMVVGRTFAQGACVHTGTRSEVGSREEEVPPQRNTGSTSADRKSPNDVGISAAGSTQKDQRCTATDGTQTTSAGRQRSWAYRATVAAVRLLGRWLGTRSSGLHGNEATPLQDRHCEPGTENSGRSGWTVALRARHARCRREERRLLDFQRVDCVEILEQGHPRLAQYREADGSLYLYDIAVERHPSFSVGGLLVHNCSMIDGRIGQDLLSFGIPVLVLGDPAQLPPVHGSGFFTSHDPDMLLTDVQRQARDNPIIDLATRVREGKSLDAGNYGTSKVYDGRPDAGEVLGADQVLVGRNATRHSYNSRMRELMGRKDRVEVGDKIVCLRNNHEIGILNGSIWWVDAVSVDPDDGVYLLSIFNEDTRLDVPAHKDTFLPMQPQGNYFDRLGAEEFCHAGALTVHKSQGSQWPNVLVVDESPAFRSSRKEWLYTAITRASEQVTVVRP